MTGGACRLLLSAFLAMGMLGALATASSADDLTEGRILVQRGECEKGAVLLQGAVNRRNDAASWSWLGRAYVCLAYKTTDSRARERLLVQAITCFETCLARRPSREYADSAQYWLPDCKTGIAGIACERGDYARALDVLTRTRNDYETSAQLEYWLGETYRRQREGAADVAERERLRGLAQSAFEACIKMALGPRDPVAIKAQEGLRKLLESDTPPTQTTPPPITPVLPPVSQVLRGHTDEITAVALTPDGRRVVSASTDGVLRLWDLETEECLHERTGHTNKVTAVAITPDGRRAVSGSWDYTVRVWDISTGQFIPISRPGSETNAGHVNMVTAVAALPDGKRAVSTSMDGRLRVWDLETGVCRLTADVEGSVAPIIAGAVSPDGRHAVCGLEDKTLRVWDVETGQLLQQLTGHSDWVRTVAVTPDGRRAVSGSHGSKYSKPSPKPPEIKVWDLETGRCIHTLLGHEVIVSAIAITPDGRRAVSGAEDWTLRVWDLEKGECLRVLSGHQGMVNAVVLTPDGQRAVSASADGTVRIWDLNTGACLSILRGHTAAVTTVVVTPDGRQIISGSRDRTLRVWSLPLGP